MRSSRFRPAFDSLDARIVLDSSTAVTGVPVAATVLAATDTDTDTSTTPDDDTTIVPSTGWYQGGTPPSTTDDLDNPPLPILYQTASSMATN
jgi:hypothetical protein